MRSEQQHALRITGGAQLAGNICISGSKNAALPEMAAALLTSETLTLKNVPKVTDTSVMAEILVGLGGTAEGEGTVMLRMADAKSSDVPAEHGRRMRATIVLLGALLGRFGHARLPRPGGDDIGARRVEQHLRGLRQMGARITETDRSPFDDPFWYGGFGAWHRPFASGRFGRPFGAPGWRRGYWGPGYDFPYYEREVALLIRDKRSGEPLYEAHAASEGTSTGVYSVLPALFVAALKDFPNGGASSPHRVTVESQR